MRSLHVDRYSRMLKDYSFQFHDVSTLGLDYWISTIIRHLFTPFHLVEIIHLFPSLSLSRIPPSSKSSNYSTALNHLRFNYAGDPVTCVHLILIIVAHLRRVDTAFSRFSLGINSTSRISRREDRVGVH